MGERLVTVIVPAYNAEATIGETLHSIREQSYRHLEILVIDDGSTDPNDRWAAGAQCTHGHEVLVLGHKNSVDGGRMVPNVAVARRGHAEFGDMRCFMSQRYKMACEGGRQLRIDQEAHGYTGRITG